MNILTAAGGGGGKGWTAAFPRRPIFVNAMTTMMTIATKIRKPKMRVM